MTITKTETITKTQTLRDCKPIFQVSSINYPVVLSCGTVVHFERGNRKDNYKDRDNYKDKELRACQPIFRVSSINYPVVLPGAGLHFE